MMSTDYTQTLKTIKEAEEESARVTAEKKKALTEQLEKAHEQTTKEIAVARMEAEAFIAREVEQARNAAEAEAKKLVASSQKEADSVATRKLGKTQFNKIIEGILLSEFKGA